MCARRRASLLALALCAACVTVGTRKGYEPSAGATLYAGPLPPGSGKTPMEPLPAGVTWIVQASRGEVYPTPGAQISLSVHLLVPEGVRVRLLTPALVLTSPDWSEPRSLPVVAVEDWSLAPPQVHAPGTELRGTATTHVHPGFLLALVDTGPRGQTRIPEVATFELRLPALEIEGEPVGARSLRFQAHERFGVWLAPD